MGSIRVCSSLTCKYFITLKNMTLTNTLAYLSPPFGDKEKGLFIIGTWGQSYAVSSKLSQLFRHCFDIGQGQNISVLNETKW